MAFAPARVRPLGTFDRRERVGAGGGRGDARLRPWAGVATNTMHKRPGEGTNGAHISKRATTLALRVSLKTETRGHVFVMTLDRPEAMNAIDPETSDAMVDAWRAFRDDEALHVAVLRGSGDRAFCAGMDLKRMQDWYGRVPAERRREVWDREPGLGGITRNLDTGKPIIAAVHGHCLGGGLELALACDIRIASDDARFGLPELQWGILPGQGGTQRLPRTVGTQVALEMILSGQPIDAARALEVGLVSRVVPRAELDQVTMTLAKTIAERPPRAVRHAREAVLRGVQLSLEEGLRLEQALAEPLRGSAENVERTSGFRR